MKATLETSSSPMMSEKFIDIASTPVNNFPPFHCQNLLHIKIEAFDYICDGI